VPRWQFRNFCHTACQQAAACSLRVAAADTAWCERPAPRLLSRAGLAVIERPAVIRQILDHLGLASTPPSLRAPPDQPDGGAAERPREWAYEPLFDDIPIPDPLHV